MRLPCGDAAGAIPSASNSLINIEQDGSVRRLFIESGVHKGTVASTSCEKITDSSRLIWRGAPREQIEATNRIGAASDRS
jgi:hypothetical protein